MILDYVAHEAAVQIALLLCISALILIPYLMYSFRRTQREKFEEDRQVQIVNEHRAEREHQRRMLEKGLITQVHHTDEG